MDGTFDFAFDGSRRTAFGGRIERASQLKDVSFCVLDHFIALESRSHTAIALHRLA